ncbi:MAG: GIY-YIG nuclease family protein [Desulfurococcales archaeon]|nr:GIY-YIG nuclease family protein [Desulfurococcales archaeon]
MRKIRLNLVEACSTIPSDCKGVYILILGVESDQSLDIGSLGRHRVEKGYYAYIGSAKGPGGIRARLCRHIHRCGRRHWHIDYFRDIAKPIAFTYCCQENASESWLYHILARRLQPYIRGFGSSDNPGVYSHLFKCGDSIEGCIEEVEACIGEIECFNSMITVLV